MARSRRANMGRSRAVRDPAAGKAINRADAGLMAKDLHKARSRGIVADRSLHNTENPAIARRMTARAPDTKMADKGRVVAEGKVTERLIQLLPESKKRLINLEAHSFIES